MTTPLLLQHGAAEKKGLPPRGGPSQRKESGRRQRSPPVSELDYEFFCVLIAFSSPAVCLSNPSRRIAPRLAEERAPRGARSGESRVFFSAPILSTNSNLFSRSLRCADDRRAWIQFSPARRSSLVSTCHLEVCLTRSRLSTAVKHPGPTAEAEVDEADVDEEVTREDSSRQVLYVK